MHRASGRDAELRRPFFAATAWGARMFRIAKVAARSAASHGEDVHGQSHSADRGGGSRSRQEQGEAKMIARRLAKVTVCLSLAGCLLRVALGGDFPDDHPALKRYPSPQDFQKRIDEAKRSDPQGWSAARADFDLAVRAGAMFIESRPIVKDRVLNSTPPTGAYFEITPRKVLLREIAELEDRPEFGPVAAWYREHLEAFVVDDTPMLRLVLVDGILNPWDDWSGWEGNPRLDALRKECPDPHRRCAWDLAIHFDMYELGGVALRRMLVAHKPDMDHNVLAMSSLVIGTADVAVLDYLLQGMSTVPEGTYSQLFTTACEVGPPTKQSAAFRDIWARYLSDEHSNVRWQATIQIGIAIEYLRIETKGKDNSDDLQAKLRELANGDPDKDVRTGAQRALDRIRTAKWRDDP